MKLIASNIEASNAALCRFTSLQILTKRNGIYVTWDIGYGRHAKRWQCRGQDFILSGSGSV